jgi:hypothetical protein
MIKLSTGQDSTLGSYHKLATLVFGADSNQVRFIESRIASNPNGANEEVVADERQMLYLLVNLPEDHSGDLEVLLK